MAQLAAKPEQNMMRVPAGTDLTEWYFEQGWTDGLPVVPPTRALVEAFVDALGGDPHFVECKVPPRHGNLTREVLAINMVMAGCRPAYAPVVRAAILALTAKAFNLNGVQATTHMAAPLLVVNGPVAREIGMNGDCNAFGSGNRANATIGRALRLVLLNVGGAWPGDLDKSTLGHPGKYTYCVAENEAASPWAPYHVEKGFGPEDSTVFVLAAEPAQLSGDARLQFLLRDQLRSTLWQDLQSQPAEMVQARAGRAHPDRAEPRPHPPLRYRRRSRAIFRLHTRLGPHVVPGIAQHRNRHPAESADLRRRHLLSLRGRTYR